MFSFARCLHLLVKIFIKVKKRLMMNPGEKKRWICVWLLYCVINFCRLVSPLISQLSGLQILNYLPPRAKNLCESTMSPLISQLNVLLQRRMHILNRLLQGGAVASWLVRSTPEWTVRVRTLAGDIVLCSWARHLTLTVPRSTQVCKWVLAICWGNLINCGGVTCDGLASRPGEEEILLAASCYKNRDKLQQLGASLGYKASHTQQAYYLFPHSSETSKL